MSEELKPSLRAKKEVLKKFYGGKRTPIMHDFSIDSGICKRCQVFIGDAKERMCPVIGEDEMPIFHDQCFR